MHFSHGQLVNFHHLTRSSQGALQLCRLQGSRYKGSCSSTVNHSLLSFAVIHPPLNHQLPTVMVFASLESLLSLQEKRLVISYCDENFDVVLTATKTSDVDSEQVALLLEQFMKRVKESWGRLNSSTKSTLKSVITKICDSPLLDGRQSSRLRENIENMESPVSVESDEESILSDCSTSSPEKPKKPLVKIPKLQASQAFKPVLPAKRGTTSPVAAAAEKKVAKWFLASESNPPVRC